eukprot:scaffold298780_cov35-Tisochrysis_lutea.AAC.2
MSRRACLVIGFACWLLSGQRAHWHRSCGAVRRKVLYSIRWRARIHVPTPCTVGAAPQRWHDSVALVHTSFEIRDIVAVRTIRSPAVMPTAYGRRHASPSESYNYNAQAA